jgi:NCAIR mutase (PurE)-related protein
VREILERVQSGALPVDGALGELRELPFRQMGFAALDRHRHLRVGFPEVVLGEGKTAEQIAALLRELEKDGIALATRVSPEKAARTLEILGADSGVTYEPVPRLLVSCRTAPPLRGRGSIAVVAAGTSDLPVAEEAARTAELCGNQVARVVDVGVAGLHRLLAHRTALLGAEVLVVVAGMEGALPSVVAGLVGRPVIAVPTSVGYGASFGGIAALLGMLNSCAAGVLVVNIDNGFGAGFAAALMNRSREAASGRDPTP